MARTQLVLLISLFLVLLCFVHGEEFNPNKLSMVAHKYSPDKTQTSRINAIFRSNMPFLKGKFAYDDLIKTMKDVAHRDWNIILPVEKVYLVDFSFLYESDPELQQEKDYFKKYPSRGELLSFPIKGAQENPRDYSSSQIVDKSGSLNWMIDDIELITTKMQEYLDDFSRDENVMIFIHCRHGQDRTGEISGAYWLKEYHRTWDQVMASNWRMNDEVKIKYTNQRALTWYCYHLQHHKGYSQLECNNDNVDSSSVKKPKLLGWDGSDPNSTDNGLVYCLSIAVPVGGASLLMLIGVILIVLFILIRGVRRSKEFDDQNIDLVEEI